MPEAFINSPGRMVAAMLTGSWRTSPPAFEHSAAELEETVPLLQKSGAAALGWWRVQYSNLRDVPVANELHQVYRLNTLYALLNQETIKQAIALVRSVGIEPILVKGWAAAQLYPAQGLRPYGDIDLCVPPEQFAAAETALKKLQGMQYEVDLHSGLEKFGGGSMDRIYARSQVLQLGESTLRVLCAEDHLRILAVHLLREGAWRPLWLCDIAAAVESRPANFDWDYCLTKERRLADWVNCALKLAGQLLCADIQDTPAAERNQRLPQWLVPVILKEWEAPLSSMSRRHRTPVANFLRHPFGVLKGLRHHWPNPIEATIGVGASFNAVPRLPLQLGNCLVRTAKFAARLPKSRREAAPEK